MADMPQREKEKRSQPTSSIFRRHGRYWRIVCDERATRWGTSLWEVDLLGIDQLPIVTTKMAPDGRSPGVVMDGDPSTNLDVRS